MHPSIRLTCLVAAHCAATFFSVAQESPGPVLHGAEADRARVLSAAIRLTHPAPESSLVSFIPEWYRTRGRYRTVVDSVTVEEGIRHIWITEGKATYLADLRLAGVTGRTYDAALNAMELREGDLFLEEQLRSDIERVLQLLGDEGHLGVRIESKDVHEEEGEEEYRLSLTLVVTPGTPAELDSVMFRGLTVTKPATAVMLSGLGPSEVWSRRAGDAARRRLSRSRIFSDVSEPRLVMTGPANVRVVFDVQEGRSNSFDGVIGYLPPLAGSETGTITGLADVQFRNLFGSARQLHARWYQERQARHEIEVSYREPAIGGWPVAGEIGLFQRRQDSTYVRFDASLSFDAEVGLDMFAGITLHRASTTPVEGYGQLVIPQSSATLLGARFAYDTRDRLVSTRSGVLYGTAVQAGRKLSSFSGVSSVSGMQKLSFDAEFYYPTFQFQSLVLTARWREVTGNGNDESDLYRLGGSTNLRGYRENEFSGSRVIWQTTEYRFFLSPSSYIGGFVDLGSIHTGSVSAGVMPRDLFRAGYGIASLVDTPIGSVGVSIAMGKGDGIGDAKLHVRLRTEF